MQYSLQYTNKRQRTPKGQSKLNNPEKLANKRQRIPKGQSKMNNPEKLANKRQRIPKVQSKMNNQEKLANKRQRISKGQSKRTIQRNWQNNEKTKKRQFVSFISPYFSRFHVVQCFSVLCSALSTTDCLFCPILLTIVLSVIVRFTTSDYSFAIYILLL